MLDYPDLTKVNRILVIKLRHLGDLLLATPVFAFLKAKIPHAEIDAYVYKEAFPILEGNEAISNFIIYDREKRGLKDSVQALLKVRKRKYDLVINLTEGDRGTIATFVSGAKLSIGLYPRDYQKKFYDICVKHTSNRRHMVERNLDAIRCLGIFPQDEDKRLVFPVSDETFSKVKESIKCFGDKRCILLHPASRWMFKWWPIEKMQKLLVSLVNRGENVVVSSANDPKEIEMVAKIIGDIKSPQILNLAGQNSLKELGALISLSKATICLDSLALHLASTFRVPTVVLFGSTSEHTWGPWQNPKGRVASSPFACRPCTLDGCGGSKMSDCLYALTVEQVLNLLDEVSN
jgi:heptosyltransferase III